MTKSTNCNCSGVYVSSVRYLMKSWREKGFALKLADGRHGIIWCAIEDSRGGALDPVEDRRRVRKLVRQGGRNLSLFLTRQCRGISQDLWR